jgi:21S rRNA (GM2251-2'-O)-methyltransferase
MSGLLPSLLAKAGSRRVGASLAMAEARTGALCRAPMAFQNIISAPCSYSLDGSATSAFIQGSSIAAPRAYSTTLNNQGLVMWGEAPSSPAPSKGTSRNTGDDTSFRRTMRTDSGNSASNNKRIMDSVETANNNSGNSDRSFSSGGGWDDFMSDGSAPTPSRRSRPSSNNEGGRNRSPQRSGRGGGRGGNRPSWDNDSSSSRGGRGGRGERGSWDNDRSSSRGGRGGGGERRSWDNDRPSARGGRGGGGNRPSWDNDRSSSRGGRGGGGERGSWDNDRSPSRGGRGGGAGRSKFDRYDSTSSSFRGDEGSDRSFGGNDEQRGRTNLRAVEEAGYVHLYGIAPILNALVANKRDYAPVETIQEEEEGENQDEDEYGDSALEFDRKSPKDLKPEAKLTPYLFVQEQGDSKRDGSKQRAVNEIQEWADRRGVPVAFVDKGVLNTLSGNRPHQGLVLRCGSLTTLDDNTLSVIPHPDDDEYDATTATPKLWLVLDEVVDPQNFGALVRSAFFLGGAGGSDHKVGMLVCSKNSAPPSPVVSAASAGALELASQMLHSTNNLPRTLQRARQDGWRILGAAADLPYGMNDDNEGDSHDEDREEVRCLDLNEIFMQDNGKPTLLVLGSEGHGMRRLVARQCTGFVRIPGGGQSSIDVAGDDEEEDTMKPSSAGVDSLNVSVTGGIMLWHLMQGLNKLK